MGNSHHEAAQTKTIPTKVMRVSHGIMKVTNDYSQLTKAASNLLKKRKRAHDVGVHWFSNDRFLALGRESKASRHESGTKQHPGSRTWSRH